MCGMWRPLLVKWSKVAWVSMVFQRGDDIDTRPRAGRRTAGTNVVSSYAFSWRGKASRIAGRRRSRRLLWDWGLGTRSRQYPDERGGRW